ncbi:MAG: LEA type 2 family protein [Candidatus Njordarchaeia archaeon]
MNVLKVLKNAKVVISVIVLVGSVAYLGLLYVSAQNVSVKKVDVVWLQPTGITTWSVKFDVHVQSNGTIDITVNKLTYKIYINGTYVGEGAKYDFTIKAGQTIKLTFELEFDAVQLGLVSILTSTGAKEIKVTGVVSVPVKPFNLFTARELTLPYTKTIIYE